MYKPLSGVIGAILGLSLVATACAEESAKDPEATIKEALAPLLAGGTIDKVNSTPISGLYEVQIGTQIAYVTGDGRYLIQGDITDLASKESITKPRERETKAEAIAKVGEENMVIFGDKDLPHTITVFTDIDCGYCRKLHSEIDSYNEAGIRVRYLFFPRAGIGSESYDKAVSVWCSDDRKKALTAAKKGEEIEKRECDNPVTKDKELGDELGVNGTPALVLEDGELVPGYIPAKRLAAYLDAKKSAAN